MSIQFEQIQILYNQLFNSVQEVKNYISNQDYDNAILKENYIAILVQKINYLKQTVKLEDNELNILNEISNKIMEIENENISNIENSKQLVLQQIKKLNNQDKLSAKYNTIDSEQDGGSIYDYSD